MPAAASGAEALRFDYFGSGESGGEDEELRPAADAGEADAGAFGRSMILSFPKD